MLILSRLLYNFIKFINLKGATNIAKITTVSISFLYFNLFLELTIKILTWAEHANNLVKLKRSDDTGSVQV